MINLTMIVRLQQMHRKQLIKEEHDEKVAVGGNLTSGWQRGMETLSKTNMLRQEFKVRGQIGEPGQRDKLTYVSLMHQIRDAHAAGYKEDKIVSRVINCMVPSLTLRGVLETTPDLSPGQLLQQSSSLKPILMKVLLRICVMQ